MPGSMIKNSRGPVADTSDWDYELGEGYGNSGTNPRSLVDGRW